MKYFSVLAVAVLTLLIVFGSVYGIKNNNLENQMETLRIHIRANSNSTEDQLIKYTVKEELVNYLTPILCECEDKSEMITNIKNNFNNLENIANNILNERGFNYTASVSIKQEEFPTRTYEGYTLESGIYDAVIVELGKASGNNWWCVVYPPLCFTNFSENSESIVYKSKIWEIINKFFK